MSVKTLFTIIIIIFSSLSFAKLPNSLKSCKYPNTNKFISIDEVDFSDNFGNRLAGCPREMIYKYSEYSKERIEVLRLTHAHPNRCWYGRVTCKKE